MIFITEYCDKINIYIKEVAVTNNANINVIILTLKKHYFLGWFPGKKLKRREKSNHNPNRIQSKM